MTVRRGSKQIKMRRDPSNEPAVIINWAETGKPSKSKGERYRGERGFIKCKN